ncbi:Cell division protein FtsB [Amycolatopsis arida]|uniref:Cell division protein FtsB n=1 Tax=Amycolatopsis arida TaxID=587909 RepID=A0A1I5PZE5_9PSEU|nr:septum formation initiator family protein [Amycolatopsis arida]TDX98659.1 cell division protein FtsB [Amycolatopsis arida]SFP39289.1 Cell division protein FtsB [Amycolatopsis arida]
MAERGRARGRRAGGRAQSSSPRRPERTRRGGRRARLRRGLSATRATGAAKVLGLSTTRRAALAAIVVGALVFTLAVPLRTYLSQRSELAEYEQRKAELEQRVARLEQRKAEQNDPAQIEAEARRRLRYVMPGETPYIVQLPEDRTRAEQPPPGQRSVPEGTWYERLWDSATGR